MIVGVLQARFSSSRLPGKVMLPIEGKPMLLRQIERVRRAERIDHIVVATSIDKSDDALAAMCESNDLECYRGSLDDVLDRFVCAARLHGPDWVVRLTGDCPLADPQIIDDVINAALEAGCDYMSNAIEPSFPDGLDVEIMRMQVLEIAREEASLPSEREHVTAFIYKHPDRFRICHYKQDVDMSHMRWTVDEPADLDFVRAVYARLFDRKPDFTTADVLNLLGNEQHLAKGNSSFTRNEGYVLSLKKDKS